MTKSVIWIIVMAALVAGVGGIALIASSFSAAGRAFVTRAVGGGSRWLVFACATGMTAGSLYFSEVAHFNPCRLCWFQRIFAYPIVIVMFFAARRRDDSGWAPAMTLAGIGSLVSVYHIAIENGVLAEGGSCDPTNPCTVNWLDTPGVPEPITIPVLALCCFVFILGVGLHDLHRRRVDSAPHISTDPQPTAA
ncbi:MAG: disulfide bond formation protein B [Microthrixaceae bacterium]|jgi:disulfide bond formation protein DsbB|nr:disulfide bond formation protein B [Actinomycetota bacterium]HMS13348.1 disulfide bond formation protein B [Microthrixaceae bacterium]HMT23243.1 disulfide bond formation protein B [Microthrixaceae bacterium]HMT59326.1 disulfide bond formation protein B [Microthrixaceae bacterium]